MINYHNAILLLRELAASRQVGSETVPLLSSVGRILANPVWSREKVPGFDNSAMDGFAISAAWTREATKDRPVELPVRGLVFAGDAICTRLSDEPAAIEIMTGAPLPAGAWDSVIKIEDVAVDRDAAGRARSIRVFSSTALGSHVRQAGEDFMPKQLALSAGTRVSAEHLLALATLGVAEVSVRKKPRVAVISTGKELMHFSSDILESGKIRNSTGPFLEAAIPRHGAELEYFGVIEDNPTAFEQLIQKILEDRFDLILSTGAISMGQMDFVGDSLERIGARILFHKVAIRPGKPVMCASFEQQSGPIYLGLPGNPVSTAVGLRFFAGPYLRALVGREPEPMHRAVLNADAKKPDGLRCFFKGAAGIDGAALKVRVLSGQASFMVSPFLHTNCWVIFSEELEYMRSGSVVEICSLEPDGWGFVDGSQRSAGMNKEECC